MHRWKEREMRGGGGWGEHTHAWETVKPRVLLKSLAGGELPSKTRHQLPLVKCVTVLEGCHTGNKLP